MHSTVDTRSRSSVARVGFIGLGDMGGAIATRIIAAGFPTVLWARRPQALTAFSGESVAAAATAAELAADVDMVGVCVWDDDAVRDVVYGPGGILAGCRPGTLLAIHSTVKPATCREIARAASERGITVLDAPVSGGRDVALEGRLVVAAGGDEDTLQRAQPVLECFADPVIHVGPVGAGQLAKLINNCLLAANLTLADDALTLAATLGIGSEAMADVLRHGSGRSYGLEVAVTTRTSPAAREQAAASLSKDIRCLTVESAAHVCAQVPLLTNTAETSVKRLKLPPGWMR